MTKATVGVILMETAFGSHLYGTATPASDHDWKAVRLPPAREILLQRVKPTITDNSKSDTSIKNAAADTDRETWALGQFFKLVGEGQTVAMDALFSTPAAWVRDPAPLWHEIVANRHRLVSSKAASFLGYCRQQANKYGIKGSRMGAAEAACGLLESLLAAQPKAKLGDVAEQVERALGGMEHIAFPEIVGGSGVTIKHIEVCGRKAPYTSSLKLAAEVFARLYDQYGARARAAKNHEGIDWKALSHAVRVGRQALELLATGHVTFPRPEAAHLVAIKTGQLAYVPVAEEIERLLDEVEAAQAASPLPPHPDYEFMDDLTAAAYRQVVRDDPLVAA